MTPLEQSLRTLAERDKRFEFKGDDFFWQGNGKLGAVDTLDGGFSQDQLDEIAGLLGWSYDVVGCYYSGKGAPGRYLNEHTGEQFWYYDIWQRQGERPISSAETFPSKLLAAQSALIAIIEKLYPIRKEG